MEDSPAVSSHLFEGSATEAERVRAPAGLHVEDWPAEGRSVVCVELYNGHVRCGSRVYAPIGGDGAGTRRVQEEVRPAKSEHHRGGEEGAEEGEQEGHEVESECEEEEQASGAEFWLYVGISCILVCSAGLFSGLTIGLMSLDLDELKMISAAPPNPHHPHNHEYAELIIPLVTDHHLLLVTLLLSNAAAMEALPIFLDKICPSPLVAILMSVTLVLFFGEVIPQALCTAYGLAIGAKTAPAVNILIKLLYIIAKPIALLLDHIFGHEIKTLRRVDWIARLDLIAEAAQDSEMVEMHEAEAGEKPLTLDELNFMKGVLGLFDKRVSTVGNDKTPIMVSIKQVYSLSMTDKLTRETLSDMLAAGFSRIPVIGDDQQSVEGIILVKNLIMVNPEEQQSVESLIVEERRRRIEQRKGALLERNSRTWDNANTAKVLIDESLLRVHKDISIFALIDLFQASKTQMALVYEYDVKDDALRRSERLATKADTEWLSEKMATAALRAAYEAGYVLKAAPPAYEADSAQGESETPRRPWITTGTTLIGLTTLEDIVEEMFGEQFVDETDPCVSFDANDQPALLPLFYAAMLHRAYAMEMEEADVRKLRLRNAVNQVMTSNRVATSFRNLEESDDSQVGSPISRTSSLGSRRMMAGVNEALSAATVETDARALRSRTISTAPTPAPAPLSESLLDQTLSVLV